MANPTLKTKFHSSTNEPMSGENRPFAYAKTKTEISCAADQHFCLHNIDITIPLLSKSKITSLSPSSVAALHRFVVENAKDRFSHNKAKKCIPL